MNRTLKLLVFSDIFVLTGFGLTAPIIAIFIKDNLVGGSIAAVGIAAAVTTLTRCLLQVLFARIAKPKHRYRMLIIGTSVIVCIPFIYLFATHIWHIYIASFIQGIGAGLANPAWFSLFANNLSKGKKGLEWSMYSSSVGVGTATSAFVGSQLASSIGFKPVFIVVGLFALIGCVILIGLTKKDMKIKKEDRKNKVVGAKFKLHPIHHR